MASSNHSDPAAPSGVRLFVALGAALAAAMLAAVVTPRLSADDAVNWVVVAVAAVAGFALGYALFGRGRGGTVGRTGER